MLFTVALAPEHDPAGPSSTAAKTQGSSEDTLAYPLVLPSLGLMARLKHAAAASLAPPPPATPAPVQPQPAVAAASTADFHGIC